MGTSYRHTGAIQRMCSAYGLVGAIQRPRGYSWALTLTRRAKAQPGSNIGPGLGARGRIRPDDIRPVLSWNPGPLFVDLAMKKEHESILTLDTAVHCATYAC